MTAPGEGEFGAQLPALGSMLANKYRIDEVLGRGGMGVVYRATNVVTGKLVAVKWLLPELYARADSRERFLREARAASRIPHPNVVDIFDVIEDRGAMFLVMEYLTGEPLSARLQREQLGFSQIVGLLLPAMRAVAMAHSRGVIHRDIKPDNLFICRRDRGDETVKVLDFGISKILDLSGGDASLTRSGMAVGTPHYMSLEQLNGERDLDGRVDVYAFAVILYRACTGHLPFDGDSYGAIAIQVATHTPTIPRKYCPDIPPMLERAVLGGLARDRKARYARMEDFIAALEMAFNPELAALDATMSAPRPNLAAIMAVEPKAPVIAPAVLPSPLPPSPSSSPRRARLGVPVLVTLTLLIGASAWWWTRAPAPAQPDVARLPTPTAVVPAPKSLPVDLLVPSVNAPPPALPATPAPSAAATPKPRGVRDKPRPVAAPPLDAPKPPVGPAPVPAPPPEVRTKTPHRSGSLAPGQF